LMVRFILNLTASGVSEILNTKPASRRFRNLKSNIQNHKSWLKSPVFLFFWVFIFAPYTDILILTETILNSDY
jgi:hypothetical protein